MCRGYDFHRLFWFLNLLFLYIDKYVHLYSINTMCFYVQLSHYLHCNFFSLPPSSEYEFMSIKQFVPRKKFCSKRASRLGLGRSFHDLISNIPNIFSPARHKNSRHGTRDRSSYQDLAPGSPWPLREDSFEAGKVRFSLHLR